MHYALNYNFFTKINYIIEIKKVDNNNEQKVQEQIDSLMPWISEDIDDCLNLEQTKKYHVGIVSGHTFMSQFINKLKAEN